MERCGAKSVDKGVLLQTGDKEHPTIVPIWWIEIEQPCVPVFFILGSNGQGLVTRSFPELRQSSKSDT